MAENQKSQSASGYGSLMDRQPWSQPDTILGVPSEAACYRERYGAVWVKLVLSADDPPYPPSIWQHLEPGLPRPPRQPSFFLGRGCEFLTSLLVFIL